MTGMVSFRGIFGSRQEPSKFDLAGCSQRRFNRLSNAVHAAQP
ncbi:MAG: hypothetical protein ACI92A_001290, partial [Candidatus Paceibacteria bacterium]